MAPLRYAAKFDPFLSLDCTPHTLHPGAIQGKEGIKFCHLATLSSHASKDNAGREGGKQEGGGCAHCVRPCEEARGPTIKDEISAHIADCEKVFGRGESKDGDNKVEGGPTTERS